MISMSAHNMLRRELLAIAPALFVPSRLAAQIPALEEIGFRSIFDGKSLTGWDADPEYWRVESGVMIGETRTDHQPKQNTFSIWRGGRPADFELKAQYRITRGNSGFQYRSIERPDVAKWVLEGYQADIDAEQTYTGQLYEERGRGFLAPRGMLAYATAGTKPGAIGSLGDSSQLKTLINNNDWNDIHIIARGDSLTHLLNGHVMCMFIDDDAAHRRRNGLIGVQLHLTTTGMKIEARNIRIKIF